MDTVLITGGGGFTGRHIVRRLAASGRKVVS
jgi:nucleoside-diphosphate-sugar epimerase